MKSAYLGRFRTLLHQRDFCLLWIGQTISAFGNPLQTVSVVWMVLQMTSSAFDLAITMLALTIPQALMTLVGGVITDRMDARTVMLWCDGIRLFTSGIIALFALAGWFPIWFLCCILIIHGAANGIFAPAANSILPNVIAEEALDGANALSQTTSQMGIVLGSFLAGLLISFGGTALACGMNALSFATAVLLVLLMRPLVRKEGGQKLPLFREGIQGIFYLRKASWLMAILFMDICASLAATGPIAVGLPSLSLALFHSGPEGYSLLLGAFSCGTVIGTFLPALYRPNDKQGLLICIVQIIEALLLTGVAFVPFPLAACCLLMLGICNGYISVLFLTLIQTSIHPKMLGRAMSLFMLSGFGFMPLSYTATALIIQWVGVRVLFLSAGGLTLLGATVGLSIPSFRKGPQRFSHF